MKLVASGVASVSAVHLYIVLHTSMFFPPSTHLHVATAPVGVADGALPLGRRHAHAAPAADPVAAAAAHGARVPQFPQRPLAAGAGALAVLPGGALGTFPPQLLELLLHPPEGVGGRSHTVVKVAEIKGGCPGCHSKLSLFWLGQDEIDIYLSIYDR